MNHEYASVLRALRRAQMSEFGLNRATGIAFGPLRAMLKVLVENGTVKKDGIRYKLKEGVRVQP